MPTLSTTLRSVAALVAAGAAVAACSSTGSHPAARRASPPPGTTTPPTTTSTPGVASSGASSGSSGSSASTTCTASALTGSVSGLQGGAGTLEITLALRNTGSSLCTMSGYAGLQLLGSSGTQLPTTVHQGGPLAFESVAPSPVSLSPGQAAYLNIGYSDVPSGGQTSCATATTLVVTPPGATALSVPVQLQACGGTLDESAVFGAGSPATQTTAPPTASS